MTQPSDETRIKIYRARRLAWLIGLLIVPIGYPVLASIGFAYIHDGDALSWPVCLVVVFVTALVYAVIWMYYTVRIEEEISNRSADHKELPPP